MDDDENMYMDVCDLLTHYWRGAHSVRNFI